MNAVDVHETRQQVAVDLAQTLKAARVQQGWSQRHLAEVMTACGFRWHQTTVGKTESGQRPLQVDELVILVGLLQLPTLNAAFGDDSTIPNQLLGMWVDHMQQRREEMEASALQMFTKHFGREAADEFSRQLAVGEADLAKKHEKSESAYDLLRQAIVKLEEVERDG